MPPSTNQPASSSDEGQVIAVVNRLLSSISLPAAAGPAQLQTTLSPGGHICHSRAALGIEGPIYHDFGEGENGLQEYLRSKGAWAAPATESDADHSGVLEEVMDGEPTVMVDRDIAMVWSPFAVKKGGQALMVGTNVFTLMKYRTG